MQYSAACPALIMYKLQRRCPSRNQFGTPVPAAKANRGLYFLQRGQNLVGNLDVGINVLHIVQVFQVHRPGPSVSRRHRHQQDCSRRRSWSLPRLGTKPASSRALPDGSKLLPGGGNVNEPSSLVSMSSAPASRAPPSAALRPRRARSRAAPCGQTGRPPNRRSQIAATLGEGVAHLGDGAIAVVCHHLNQHGDAAGRIALVGELLHVVGIVGTGTAGDGAIDGIAGHIGAQGLVHRRAQAGIILRLAVRPAWQPPPARGSAW